MPVRKKSLDQLNRASFERVVRDTNITNLTPGGAARALIESVNINLEQLYEALEVSSSMTFISLARGFYLDLLGQLIGVRRRQQQTAQVYADDRNLRFHVVDGFLSTYLPHPSDVTKGRIPAGTEVTNSSSTVVYEVTQAVDFSATATEVYTGAQARATGLQGNVGRRDLSTHNLGQALVLVENIDSVRSGADVEDDETYRSRILNRNLAAETGNQLAIRLATLSTPGVADVRIVPGDVGSGAIRLLVIPQGNRVPLRTLETVVRRIQQAAAFGISIFVDEPRYVPVSIIVDIRTSVTGLGEEPLRQTIENTVRAYIGDIRPGEELVINVLRALILEADPDIQDLKILQLCVDRKPVLLQNITLEDDELFLPDPELSDPIRII
jgi:uncharacterized phage protein gp47/JayE